MIEKIVLLVPALGRRLVHQPLTPPLNYTVLYALIAGISFVAGPQCCHAF